MQKSKPYFGIHAAPEDRLVVVVIGPPTAGLPMTKTADLQFAQEINDATNELPDIQNAQT